MTTEARFSTGTQKPLTNGGTRVGSNCINPYCTFPSKNNQFEIRHAGTKQYDPELNKCLMYGSVKTVDRETETYGAVQYMDSTNISIPRENISTTISQNNTFGMASTEINPNGIARNPAVGTDNFMAEKMHTNTNSGREVSLVNGFEEANNELKSITLKVLSKQIVPGKALHGCVYFDVLQPTKINAINVTIEGTLKKKINKKSESKEQTYAIMKPVVGSGNIGNQRNSKLYKSPTLDYSGEMVESRLNLPWDIDANSPMLQAFSAPILLPIGTHVIPFAVKISDDVNPSISYKRRNKTNKATVKHEHTIRAEIFIQSNTMPNPLAFITDPLEIIINSVGGLPEIFNQQFLPANGVLVNNFNESASALLLFEQKHIKAGSTIRVHVYANEKNAVRYAFVQLLKSTNLNEIGLKDTDYLATNKKNNNVELLFTSKKIKLSSKNVRQFKSDINEPIPKISSLNNIQLSSRYSSLMPESDRKENGIIEIAIPKDLESSFEIGENRIRYHLRVHLMVKDNKKTVSHAEMITINELLLPNYTIKYIDIQD